MTPFHSTTCTLKTCMLVLGRSIPLWRTSTETERRRLWCAARWAAGSDGSVDNYGSLAVSTLGHRRGPSGTSTCTTSPTSTKISLCLCRFSTMPPYSPTRKVWCAAPSTTSCSKPPRWTSMGGRLRSWRISPSRASLLWSLKVTRFLWKWKFVTQERQLFYHQCLYLSIRFPVSWCRRRYLRRDFCRTSA